MDMIDDILSSEFTHACFSGEIETKPKKNTIITTRLIKKRRVIGHSQTMMYES